MFKFLKKSHSVSVIGCYHNSDISNNYLVLVFSYIEKRKIPSSDLLLNRSFFANFFSEVLHRSFYSDDNYFHDQSERCVYFLYYHLFKNEKFSFVDSPFGSFPVRILKSC